MSKKNRSYAQEPEEVAPNKGFSFILGCVIAMAIIILFVLLFPK
ncbi:MAG TPA: hypothetical protein VL461_02385 [Dictyobacter sp.]|jgi:hypothetical protein|nr:hypothetical protein [Dictyobacter sp.]